MIDDERRMRKSVIVALLLALWGDSGSPDEVDVSTMLHPSVIGYLTKEMPIGKPCIVSQDGRRMFRARISEIETIDEETVLVRFALSVLTEGAPA